MGVGALIAAHWALQQSLQRGLRIDRKMRQLADVLEAEAKQIVDDFAAQFGLDRETAQRALVAHDRGHIAVEEGNVNAGLPFLNEAMRLAPRFASPHNNLALAHYRCGEYDEAIARLHHVLDEIDPQNFHALGSMVRVLVTKGNREEALPYAERLAQLPIKNASQRLKVAEAFATLDDDQKVYDLLSKHSDDLDPHEKAVWHYILGTAAARLGKLRESLAAYRAALKAGHRNVTLHRRIRQIERALADGSPLPRWLYFEEIGAEEVREELRELIRILSRKKLDEEQCAAEIRRYAAQHPRVVDAVCEMLYTVEGPMAEQAVGVLQMMGTEEAVNALRTFAFGTAGADEARMAALFALAELNQVSAETPVRMWLEGEWKEILPRKILVADRESPYLPQVKKQIEAALVANRRGDVAKAKRIWRQLIAEHPQVREAYNNLAALLLNEGNKTEGEAMLKKAVEVDPNYVFPRVNLASLALHRGDLDAAEEWLKPIGMLDTMHPDELAAFFRVSAMLHIERGDYKAAEKDLEGALSINPHDVVAQDLLKELRGGFFGRLRRLWR